MPPDSTPGNVAVVGAGMVGLATAWFLQEHDVQVTVVDRVGVAAGASWGNAGQLTPAFTTPLPHPSMLRLGLKAIFSPASPVVVPIPGQPSMWSFLAALARHCTHSHWQCAMAVFNELNRLSLDAYDRLAKGGIQAATQRADPFLVACTSLKNLAPLREEFDRLQTAGGEVRYELTDGEELRALAPTLSTAVRAGMRVHGQRFINPPEYLHALAAAVRSRGGKILEKFDVRAVRDHGLGGVELISTDARHPRADAVVLANGAWLTPLARPFGLRRVVYPGRGYSFSVNPMHPPTHPIELPGQRVACNPQGVRLRITGTMEFRRADAPLNRRCIHAIIDSIRPMFSGVDWSTRHDEWVGSRPCTADGLPLIGPTRSPRVYVAGGHGMWGIVLGPVTGKLLADLITTGTAPDWLRKLDPLR